MKPTLLFLENGSQRYGVSRLDKRFLDAGFAVDLYWTYKNEFPDTLTPYDGAVLTGSRYGAYDDVPFIHREHDLIASCEAAGIPMLGICFGSQILASALCGRDQVFRRSHCEFGYKWLMINPPHAMDPLVKGLGESVRLFIWHNDEVRHDHPDMRILASSDLCPNQVWRYKDRPVWGIQGHPEIALDHAEAWFEGNRSELEMDGADVDGILSDADEAADAKIMLTNFMDVCRK